jgi:hypothetical protein
MSLKQKRGFFFFCLSVVAAALVWTRVQADKATTQTLGGAERYLSFVSTDKPIYRAGEKVYVRGVLLNAADRKPLPANQQANPTIEIKGPKGDTVANGMSQTQDAVWGFAWEVPQGQAGGEYTVKVTYPWQGHAPAERKFDIRAYRAPRLRSQIVFLRDGYGPGDKVTATLHTERAEGGFPEGAKVGVIARVDGTEIRGADGKVDVMGNCAVTFDLPKAIERGEGTLALVIEDGGTVETASKTIPILLQTLDIKFYPEGGDLVAGMPNRVYFEARQPNGKPADIEGVVLDEKGSQLCEFRTEHEGRGRFALQRHQHAQVAFVTKPSGIRTKFPLPKTDNAQASVEACADIYPSGQALEMKVCLPSSGAKYRVTLSKRENEICSEEVATRPFITAYHVYHVQLKPDAGVDGVLRVTVWDEKGVPLAERLVYREPAKKLNVAVTPEMLSHVPGGQVKLNVKTTDSDGKPVAAVVGLTVTDDSVLEMIEKREQAPRLPVMVFLEPEVKELADAHVYLDPENPKAPLALDLLLGTQGWRRFAFVDSAKFIAENGDAAKRVLALRLPQPPAELRFRGGGWGGGMDGAEAGAVRAAAVPPAPARPVAEPASKAAAKPEANRAGEKDRAAAPREQLAKEEAAPRAELAKAVADADKKQAERQLVADGLRARRKMRADAEMEQRANFVVVREYAHQVRANRQPTDRVDFTETLYWSAGVKTDANGAASVAFGLNDSVTTFRVFADAFNTDGVIGVGISKLESVQPFYVEPKLPLEVTSGDTILLPLTVVNAIASDLGAAELRVDCKGELKIQELKPFDLPAMQRVRQILPIRVGHNNGALDFTILAKCGPYEDKVVRKLSAKPMGFPIEVPFGGMLGANKTVTHTLTIPEGFVMRSLTTNVAVYPTPLANMTEALQRLIQDPNGCFEQTSSTSYPLTMAQQYFLSHTGVDPRMVEMARQKLDAGYRRLVGFWCPDRGYEWFGQNPGHEALTAFGVLHFTDMAQVREVDQSMIANTRGWLLKQRDGAGGFTRKRRALHTWIEDKDCSNAYILWALLEAGQPVADLEKEIASLKTAAAASQNSYVVALGANALALAGDKAEAAKLMERLVAKQNKDGAVEGGTASIVGSGGEALMIETTSLAALAWLRDPNYAGAVEKSMKFLADSCKAGRYGSTQSTVLALRAIVTYDKQRAKPKAPGKVQVFVDGQGVGGWLPFDQTTQGAIKLPDVSELLTKGEHKIELKMQDGGDMPYSVAINYNAVTPASSKECKLDIAVKLAGVAPASLPAGTEAVSTIVEGSATEANVTVTNKAKEVVPTPVAIVGLPGGLEPRHDQLKELVKKGTIDAYEVIGREVVLYWRTMAAEAKVDVPLSLIAAVPGTYTGPASRAYLYYTDEHKQWVEGVKVSITPK